MKLLLNKLFTFFILLSCTTTSIAQTEIIWEENFGTEAIESAIDMINMDDSSFIIISDSISAQNNQEIKYKVTKLDENRNTSWEKCYGIEHYYQPVKIVSSFDGGFIITGHCSYTGPLPEGFFGGMDGFVQKLDSAGNEEWIRNYGGSEADVFNAVIADSTGGFLLGGWTSSTDYNLEGINTDTIDNCWLIKIDDFGEIEWQHCYGEDSVRNTLRKMVWNGDELIIGGSACYESENSNLNYNQCDVWVFSLDENYEIIWDKHLTGSATDHLWDLICSETGSIIIAGETMSFDEDFSRPYIVGNRDGWMGKLSNSGELKWLKFIGGSMLDELYDVCLTHNNAYMFIGSGRSHNGHLSDNHQTDFQSLSDIFTIKTDTCGNVLWHRCFGGFDEDYRPRNLLQIKDSTFVFIGTTKSSDGDVSYNHGLSDIWLVNFRENLICGNVYLDYNHNCTYDSLDESIESQTVTISPGNFTLSTNRSGVYSLPSLPVGTYTVSTQPSDPLWISACPTQETLIIENEHISTTAPQFGFFPSTQCTSPFISIYMFSMRPGFSEQIIYIRARNEASATNILYDAHAIIDLPDHINVDSSNFTYETLEDNCLKIPLGNLYPGTNKNIKLYTTIDASTIIGQTLCMSATLFPADSCLYTTDTLPNESDGISTCNLPWNNSSIEVRGTCHEDSIVFSIINVGDGDMVCYSPVRIYIDGEFYLLDSVKLQSGEIQTFTFPGTGQTWRLEVDQHPLHPGNSHPNAVVELCGDAINWTPGLVTIQYQDDTEPFKDIYCGQVSGSYDPNDKQVTPKGIGVNGNIRKNQKLEYIIRFQNTGNDTAFNIIIQDILDKDLDIFTVKEGVSSHPCKFTIQSPRLLTWEFEDILLPDSTTNEIESHGFVTFSANTVKDITFGSQIKNKAEIYFDFNEAIKTNTTVNTIYNFSSDSIQKEEHETKLPTKYITLYPNPAQNFVNIVFPETEGISKLSFYNVLGYKLFESILPDNSSTYILDISQHEDGVYFIKLETSHDTKIRKLVIHNLIK